MNQNEKNILQYNGTLGQLPKAKVGQGRLHRGPSPTLKEDRIQRNGKEWEGGRGCERAFQLGEQCE